MKDTPELLSTPLTDWHRQHGGRLVPFAGFEMPVQYTSVLAEHATVRDQVGLFDITHMGEIRVTGADAGAWLDSLVTNKVAAIKSGRAVYNAMCREDGGVLDDMLIYRLAEHEYYVVCNASNQSKIVTWLGEHLPAAGVTMQDESYETALIAVQGPEARTLLTRIDAFAAHTETMADLKFYSAFALDVDEKQWLVSRTGYTGELGFEIYLPNAAALPLWEELLTKGEDLGAAPIGLAARDTLRFELAYCLYGHELSEDVTPLEAGIGWAVKLKKESFVGRDALVRQKAEGVPRKLIGIAVTGKAIARQGAVVRHAGRDVGRVTSGTYSPTRKQSLALALVAADVAADELTVAIRDREFPCTTVPIPFLTARVKGDPRAKRDLS